MELAILSGLDVHDVGITRPNGKGPGRILEPGMVLTVEPGLYFPLWTGDGAPLNAIWELVYA